jgi:late competence protein required for DNA uptake (superfamily II DNA/RNA helicase)
MKTVNLKDEKLDLEAVIDLARKETEVLLILMARSSSLPKPTISSKKQQRFVIAKRFTGFSLKGPKPPGASRLKKSKPRLKENWRQNAR